MTLPAAPSLTVAPVFVASTCSSLLPVIVKLKVPVAGVEPSSPPSAKEKSKLSVVVSLPS